MRQLKNPLIAQVVSDIEAKVPKGKEQVFAKIVLGAEKAIYSKETQNMAQAQMDRPGPPEKNAAEGAVKLLFMLFQQSKSTMPMDVAVLAVMTVMYEFVQLLEDAGRIEITPMFIDGITKAFIMNLVQALGISAKRLDALGKIGTRFQDRQKEQNGVISQQRMGQSQQMQQQPQQTPPQPAQPGQPQQMQ